MASTVDNSPEFQLIPDFNKCTFITDLQLSRVMLQPKLDFPWILLIPRRTNVLQINHLSMEDQLQLTREINYASNIMEKTFPCDRLNVAAIGNKSPQLHIHIICRLATDPLFPDVVWNKEVAVMDKDQLEQRTNLLKIVFSKESL